jgi:hypothetical protein
VDWDRAASAATELRERVERREPGLSLCEVGLLAREWNVHPKGSPVFADARDFSGSFVVVDVAPSPI